MGRVAQALGCIFVDEAARTSQGGRSGTVTALEARSRARLDASNRHKWKHPPLLVFPEGTTTNGKYLLRFRSGAFRLPVRVGRLDFDILSYLVYKRRAFYMEKRKEGVVYSFSQSVNLCVFLIIFALSFGTIFIMFEIGFQN